MGEKSREAKRVVLDTNVVVSALLFDGRASALAGLWREGKIVPLVSDETLREIIRALAYPKFALTQEEIKSILNEDILPYVETVNVSRKIEGVCSDPADDMFLTCAANSKAEAIISGDVHLLRLKQFEGIPISRIAEFIGPRGIRQTD